VCLCFMTCSSTYYLCDTLIGPRNVCMHVCMYVCMYIQYVCMVYMYSMCIYMYVCVCVYIYIYIYVYSMYVCMYIYIYVMCVCIYIYIYTHTVCVYVCMCVQYFVFFSLHAPLLAVLLHALLWYLQIQCLEISTLIISYYEISLIYLI